MADKPLNENDIAIVGMAAHLPEAEDTATYWRNLRDGVSSIKRLSEEDLTAAGEDPGLMRHRDYVPYAATLKGFKDFDAEFYGFSPKEAAIMDPQHRQFLECAWEALEDAGHVPESFDGEIGVFAGCGMGSYFYFNICSNPDLVEKTGMFLLRHTGNDKDFMTTRLSHVLDLHGPSINIQTACSTSLVAVHYAAQSLLNGECDMALAGGVTIELPHGRGYLYKENEILSPDGECHAFDHRARGTVFGSGAGVVVLRRLADALADGDHIWGVIKGSAVNNDGAAKAGYLAPSVEGQAAAIAEAQAVAGVTSDTVDYVECHGTGTYLGDPIEVAALTEAFRETSGAVGHCRIGSVKTNIGHLDTAAGVASLIKATLALYHRQMPPSLGFERPNPEIAFDGSPFVVNDRLTAWTRGDHPRRAGVNSLGVGGTNAHVVLEEAPEVEPSRESDWPFQILTVSGRNKAALEDNAARLAAHLRAHPEQSLADVAYTLKEGRRAFAKRMVVVAETHEEAADILEGEVPMRLHQHEAMHSPEVVFMFPGGGAQYAGMGRDLYETEPVFAEWMDRGFAHLDQIGGDGSEAVGSKLRDLWLAADKASADQALLRPSLQLPLIMITEYALAQLWMSWGVEPTVVMGHSMGENTAACVAGVMSFEECIGLVHLRGQLFDSVPKGGMISVALSAEALMPLLGDDLDLASVNGPELSVASGPQAALDALAVVLTERDIQHQRVGIDIAAHSRMLDPILEPFRQHLRGMTLSAPTMRIMSNRSGEPMTDAEAMDPEYWVGHLRNSILFADCVAACADQQRVFLEVGPGKTLASLARQSPKVTPNQILASLRHRDEKIGDDKHMFEVLGRLAALGVNIDWDQIWGEPRARKRVPLPTYAFQRETYFIEPGKLVAEGLGQPKRVPELEDWGWKPVWRPRSAPIDVTDPSEADSQVWLIFADEYGISVPTTERLKAAGHRVVTVKPGDAFVRLPSGDYVLAPERGREGFDFLLQDLASRGLLPSRIAHFWLVTMDEKHRPGSSFFHRVQEHGFFTLLFLAQALEGESVPRPVHITVVTNGAARVGDEPMAYPEKATIAGPARVIPHEMDRITVSTLDITVPVQEAPSFWSTFWGRHKADAMFRRETERLHTLLVEEMLSEPGNWIAALREGRRFESAIKPVQLKGPEAALEADAAEVSEDTAPTPETQQRPDAKVILITGGLGGVGLTLAEDYAARGAKIALVAREALPDHDHWEEYLRRHAPSDRVSRRIEAVQRLEAAGAAAGGEIMVVAADVCNARQMEAAREAVEKRFGRIEGVIHAAGVINDGPIMTKTSAVVEDVFTPKIHGTEVLGRVFPDGDLDWMVLFASSSTVTAPAGQVDYVAANEFLNAYAQARSGKTRIIALNWGIWNEVGMAAEAVAARTGDIPQPTVQPVGRPMLEDMSFDANGNRIFSARYSVNDWWIGGHRTRSGDALMPGTGYLAMITHGLRAHHENGAFELQDLSFLRPLKVADQGTRNIRMRLKRTVTGYQVDVQADVSANGRQGFANMAQGVVSLLPMAQPERIDLDAVRARCGRRVSGDGTKLVSAQEVHLDFGPQWRVMDTRALGNGEGIADLSLSEKAREEGWLLNPALMDIATGWAMDLIDGYQPSHLWVPVRYASICVHGPVPDKIVSWVRNGAQNRADGEVASFDITICAPDGTVLVEITGFTIRKLKDPAALHQVPRITPGEIEFDSGNVQALSPEEERLAANLAQGILPDEGVEMFHRVLDSGLRQVVVSSMELPALVEQAGRKAGFVAGQTFDRPQLESDYAAPEGEIEERLAGFWQELLGVTNVGAEDSFFDLGGHSLIAVRLFAMIRKSFKVDLPMSVLFEAPTIRACAKMIEQDAWPQDGGDEAGDGMDQSSAKPRRFTHLVAMHEGEGGHQRPFFLVAGMFGNVLNLRHLAHLLGKDRPFYGLQARGLYGGADPHETIEEAATDYIAEMRQVQPHGPYMIGGFSGGGITAYEIARQLEAQSEQVDIVVLLDTPLPQRRPLTTLDRMIIQLRKAQDMGITYPYKWARDRIAWEIEKRRTKEATDTEHSFHNAEIEAAFYRAIGTYQVKPWAGRLVLYRPPLVGKWTVSGGKLVSEERAYVLEDNDWSGFAPNLEVYEVPGNHDSMVLEPNVRALAALMRAAIHEAETGSREGGEVLPFPHQAAE